MKLNWKLFAPLVVAIIVWLIGAPEGLSANSWIYVSIFAGLVVGLFATLILQIPGVDPAQVMLILLVPMGIMGILTPYGTGHSPIWFASGYNKGPEFWKLGAIFGIIYLAIFIVVGIPWIQFVMPLLG